MFEGKGRIAPFTGIIFAILNLIGTFITPTTPDPSASGASVISFYQSNGAAEQYSVALGMVVFAFLMLFATSLRSFLRRDERAEGLSALVLPAATLFVVGFTISAGFTLALAGNPAQLETASAQTLNLLDAYVSLTIFIGAGLFGIASGLAILAGNQLPRWLGWLALVIGLASFAPWILGFSLIALSVWVLITGALMYRRWDRGTPATSAGVAPS